MKCIKCNEEINDEAVICPKCGCYTQNYDKVKCDICGELINKSAVVCPKCGCYTKRYITQKEKENTNTVVDKKGKLNSVQTAAFVFMIIGCIFGAFLYLIPLIWSIPMTIIYYQNCKQGYQTGVCFKICSLLFVSQLAGILMLCDK